jgi:DNA-binding response OmpR family regulator
MILVIEGNPALQLLLKINLEARGYAVTIIPAPPEDFSVYNVKLVLLDLHYKNAEAWHYLKQLTAVPVIVMTTSQELADAALKYPDVRHVVFKPFKIRDLITVVSSWIQDRVG